MKSTQNSVTSMMRAVSCSLPAGKSKWGAGSDSAVWSKRHFRKICDDRVEAELERGKLESRGAQDERLLTC